MFTDTAGTTVVSADDDQIARINDKSAGGYDLTQSTPANCPLYKTAIQNSFSVGRFDGTDDILSSSVNFGITGSATRSVFTVFRRVDTSARNIVAWGGGSTATRHGQTSEYFLRFVGVTRSYANQGANNTWTIWSLIGGGTTITTYDAYFDNGGVATPVSTGGGATTLNTVASALHVGGFPATNFANGDFAEVLIYDSALSTADREAVRDYLNAKWAVY